ncbi:MAG: GAF domain-containing sensor histidine kinase, partial [Chloroflexota bacterium]|nr:GAF domain-containing sensor histidine kinase [Chloroflexota bacterium]
CTACQFFGYAEKAELTACQVSDIVPEKAAATLSAVMTAELATEGACLESWGRHTATPVVIADTLADTSWVSQKKEWRRSYVGAPILINGETVGFLNVNSTEPNRFSTADGRRLQSFAIYAGTAIHNARLHQQLRQHAAELEQRVAARTADLATQNARLEAILQSVTDGIVVTDPAGNILLANQIAEKWSTQFLPPADAQKLREAFTLLARATGEEPDLTLELSGADLQLQAAPVLFTGEEKLQVIITIHDVSELKSLERLKSQFISSISHELRTPLTAIKLYAQLLQYKDPDKEDEYLTTLNHEIDYLIEMVERILRFSQVNVLQMTLEPELTDLNALLGELINGRQAFAQQKELTLSFHPHLDLPLLALDREKIQRVFLSLINNALYYTPVRGQVRVCTALTTENDQEWFITKVQDTGLGIACQELPHIFKRFYRGANPRRKQLSGFGLGLAIAKELVEVHGGWITVESKENQGSIFTVWLPVNQNLEQLV